MALKTFDEKVEYIGKHIADYPDFPKKGILFKDIFSALTNGSVCKVLQEVLLEVVRRDFPDVEAIVGLEARGFLFCFSLAAELGVACVPVRKKGKLPGKLLSYDYVLEYGTDTFQVQADAFPKKGLRCLLVDDLIATGGSLEASVKLLQQAGCQVQGCLAVMELQDLNGRKRIPDTIPVHSLLKY